MANLKIIIIKEKSLKEQLILMSSIESTVKNQHHTLIVNTTEDGTTNTL